MEVSIHLRTGPNKTNMRSEALKVALEAHGYKTTTLGRDEPSRTSDLVVQTGFARSVALLDAIEREVPYIIMEASPFRTLDVNEYSSWGYNGLAGGAWRPEPPSEERWKPELHPLKTDGDVLIIGQKPTDHSLRGSDHVQWITERLREYPQSRFRPHPLMVPNNTLASIESDLDSARLVVTYTSTAGVDARIRGCRVRADGRGSFARDSEDRERWLHALSWAHSRHQEYSRLIPYIMSGYDEALARAEAGDQEIPREKLDGPSVCERYYRALGGINAAN